MYPYLTVMGSVDSGLIIEADLPPHLAGGSKWSPVSRSHTTPIQRVVAATVREIQTGA